jgi:RimJ/RimL family protein N-acetyltransferase
MGEVFELLDEIRTAVEAAPAIQTPVGELVGMIEISVDYSHFAGLEFGDANVSYGLCPQYRGRGLATASLLKARDFMISKGVQRAVIRIEPENINSIRLAERCGYSRTGVRGQTPLRGGDYQFHALVTTNFMQIIVLDRD